MASYDVETKPSPKAAIGEAKVYFGKASVELKAAEKNACCVTQAALAAGAIENARLVKALCQRTAELEARNEELKAFAHTVAHDLKAPLASVLAVTDLLKENSGEFPGEELGKYLGMIARGGRRMANIIDELLLLAETDQGEIEARPLNMKSIVTGALQRVSHMIEETHAEIILPESWPVALGYGPWVEEVWTNYLSNAVKYGGRPPRVELGASRVNEMVRFEVRDNGRGLTAEEQARLFTPFTRLSQASTKGDGLGLSIVRRIVDRLGGTVLMESELGHGSVFGFTLPAIHQDYFDREKR